MPEKQWSCGCMEVDGKLVQECTQVKPVAELQSGQISRYSPVCFRKAQENRPERRVDTTQPPVEVKHGV